MSGLSKLFKDTAIYGLSTVIGRLLFFFSTPIYVGTFAPDIYGKLTDVYSLSSFIVVLLPYGLETAFFKFYKTDTRSASTGFWGILASSMLFGLMLYFGYDGLIQWKGYSVEFVSLFMWMGVILILDALCVIPFAYLRERGHSLKYAIFKLSNISLNLILVLIFLKTDLKDSAWVSHPLVWVFVANGISSLLTLLAVLGNTWHFLKQPASWALWKLMSRFGGYIALAGIFYMVNQNIDKQMLVALLPVETAYTEMGIYSACFKLGVFMMILIQGIRLGLAPFMFDTKSDENTFKSQYATATEMFTLLLVIGMIGIMTCLPIIARFFIPNEAYWSGLKIVPYLLIANLMFGLYSFMSMWYQRTDRPYIGTLLTIGGAVLTVAVNYFGIPHFGYMASIFALMLSYFFMFLTSFVLGLKMYPLPLRLNRFVMLIALGCGTTWAIGLVYDSPTQRYGLGVMSIGIIALLYRAMLLVLKEKVLTALSKK